MKNTKKLSVFELVTLSLLGALIFVSKQLTEILPNFHFITVLIMSYTLVYRKKALYPIYIFVILEGLISGFSLWWIPYFYLWLVPFGLTMLIPERLRNNQILISSIAFFCGITYGTFYAPFQCIAFRMSLPGTLSWIVAGLPWDLVHAVSNLCLSFLVLPLVKLLSMLKRMYSMNSRV